MIYFAETDKHSERSGADGQIDESAHSGYNKFTGERKE